MRVLLHTILEKQYPHHPGIFSQSADQIVTSAKTTLQRCVRANINNNIIIKNLFFGAAVLFLVHNHRERARSNDFAPTTPPGACDSWLRLLCQKCIYSLVIKKQKKWLHSGFWFSLSNSTSWTCRSLSWVNRRKATLMHSTYCAISPFNRPGASSRGIFIQLVEHFTFIVSIINEWTAQLMM